MVEKSHLVIGSNSFLGYNVSKQLFDSGEKVLGVYNKNRDNLFSEIEHIQIEKLKTLEDDFDFVYIISAFVPNQYSKNVKENLEAVNIRLVDAICKQFTSAKIIFCSSVSVYQESQNTITETSVTKPLSDYGKSKLLGEGIVAQHNKYAIVRIASMFGVNMKVTTFLPLIIKQALIHKEITIFGDGSRLQNYIHVQEVSKYIINAGAYKSNGVFLATSKTSISNTSLAKTIQMLLPETKITYKALDASKSYLYDNSKTKSQLKIKEENVLKTELQNIITWMRKES